MTFFHRLTHRPQQLWVRQLNFQIHLWAGVLLAIYLLVIGFTGAILVFEQELQRISGLDPWYNSPAQEPFADLVTVVAKIRAAYPHFRIVSIARPNQADPTFVT